MNNSVGAHREGLGSWEKWACPRHRTQSRASADFQERAIETRERQAARSQCDEGLAEYLEEEADND